ncbi:MAG: hypothetical protein VKK32_07320 [Candidatus Melainabacteria bacterium]|jgi:hypothetical protein|nr:hypothetical protein [Candidatus Melainabacteria bacterium]
MKQLRLRRNIGSYLKLIREKKEMPQDVVIEFLRDFKVKCSKANLSKLERDLISCRADILGALSLIYEIDPKEVLFKKV